MGETYDVGRGWGVANALMLGLAELRATLQPGSALSLSFAKLRSFI